MIIDKSQFKFKGTREYVHGTDIYNFILDHLLKKNKNLSEFSKYNLNFLRQTVHNVDFYLGSMDDFQSFSNKEAITFRGSVVTNGESLLFWGVENTTLLNERYGYDEKKIEDACAYINSQIVYDSKLSELSFIENLIPMNKKLLALACPDYKGKWMFTRLDLSMPIPQKIPDQLALEVYQSSNPKLVCSNILKNGEKIGRIFFSLT